MTVLSPITPWDRSKLTLNTDPIIKAKNTSSDLVVKTLFEITIRTKFSNYIEVYRDGSKTEDGDSAFVGAAHHIPSLQAQKGWWLYKLHSVLSAELFAIRKDVEWISQSLQPSSVLFCIDSKAALESLTTRKPVYFFPSN